MKIASQETEIEIQAEEEAEEAGDAEEGGKAEVDEGGNAEEGGKAEDDQIGVIILMSADGRRFIVNRKSAVNSGTIKGNLHMIYNKPGPNETILNEINSRILYKVCEYFNYKEQYKTSTEVAPEFDPTADMALDILMAANFLDC